MSRQLDHHSLVFFHRELEIMSRSIHCAKAGILGLE
jgi:hypothetical protein